MEHTAYDFPDSSGFVMTSDTGIRIGARHHFPDGVVLHVVDIKQRDTGPWVTYETIYPNALPKRTSMKLGEFTSTYGHLFQKA